MEIQGTPYYWNTRESHTTHDEFDLSDAIESPPHTPTAEKLQNTTSPTPDSSIKLLPHHSASSKSSEQ